MSESKLVPSGNDGKSLSEASKDQSDSDLEVTADKVSLDTHKRLLSQYKTAQLKLKEYESQLNLKQEQERKLQEEKLTKDGEWQKLVALKEQEAASAKQEAERLKAAEASLKKNLFDAAKLQAVRERLPGQLIRPEYMNFIDVEQVVLNPETNEIDESSIDLVVNDFVKNHAALLKTDPLRLPNGNAKPATRLTHDEWLRLPAKEKRSRMKDVEGFKPRS